MHKARTFAFLIPLAFAGIASAAPIHGTANVLPEVRKQLAAGHKCVVDGSFGTASAHADVVLISDNVAVYVNTAFVPASQRSTCLKAIQASLSEWQSALDDTIHFHLEDDPAKADIKVTFRADVRMGREAVAGLTNWTRSIHTDGQVSQATFKADMQVRARNMDFHPLSFEAMRQETEHEFGHCLGLDDSDHLGDLMGLFDVAHLVSGPRDYEIQAVKDLREEAKQIKADANKQH